MLSQASQHLARAVVALVPPGQGRFPGPPKPANCLEIPLAFFLPEDSESLPGLLRDLLSHCQAQQQEGAHQAAGEPHLSEQVDQNREQVEALTHCAEIFAQESFRRHHAGALQLHVVRPGLQEQMGVPGKGRSEIWRDAFATKPRQALGQVGIGGVGMQVSRGQEPTALPGLQSGLEAKHALRRQVLEHVASGRRQG